MHQTQTRPHSRNEGHQEHSAGVRGQDVSQLPDGDEAGAGRGVQAAHQPISGEVTEQVSSITAVWT
jgi:hypothetical protein